MPLQTRSAKRAAERNGEQLLYHPKSRQQSSRATENDVKISSSKVSSVRAPLGEVAANESDQGHVADAQETLVSSRGGRATEYKTKRTRTINVLNKHKKPSNYQSKSTATDDKRSTNEASDNSQKSTYVPLETLSTEERISLTVEGSAVIIPEREAQRNDGDQFQHSDLQNQPSRTIKLLQELCPQRQASSMDPIEALDAVEDAMEAFEDEIPHMDPSKSPQKLPRVSSKAQNEFSQSSDPYILVQSAKKVASKQIKHGAQEARSGGNIISSANENSLSSAGPSPLAPTSEKSVMRDGLEGGPKAGKKQTSVVVLHKPSTVGKPTKSTVKSTSEFHGEEVQKRWEARKQESMTSIEKRQKPKSKVGSANKPDVCKALRTKARAKTTDLAARARPEKADHDNKTNSGVGGKLCQLMVPNAEPATLSSILSGEDTIKAKHEPLDLTPTNATGFPYGASSPARAGSEIVSLTKKLRPSSTIISPEMPGPGLGKAQRPSSMYSTTTLKRGLSNIQAPAFQTRKARDTFEQSKFEQIRNDKEAKEKIEAARKARTEAAEKGRQASREWAEKKRKAAAAAAAKTKLDLGSAEQDETQQDQIAKS